MMGHLASNVAPLSALAGGALIGLAASALMLLIGQVAGISGMITGLLRPVSGQWSWRAAFITGLFAGGFVWFLLDPAIFGQISRPLPLVATAGVVVGYGVSLGGGCTSGHGVCGLSRFSYRSLVAVCTFMGTGIVVASLWRLAFGVVQ